MKHRFQKGNQAAKGHGRPVGAKGRINREEVIQLCNLVISDFVARYDELTIYQRMKLLSIMQNILRDAMVEPADQAGATIPQIITLQPVYANELKDN